MKKLEIINYIFSFHSTEKSRYSKRINPPKITSKERNVNLRWMGRNSRLISQKRHRKLNAGGMREKKEARSLHQHLYTVYPWLLESSPEYTEAVHSRFSCARLSRPRGKTVEAGGEPVGCNKVRVLIPRRGVSEFKSRALYLHLPRSKTLARPSNSKRPPTPALPRQAPVDRGIQGRASNREAPQSTDRISIKVYQREPVALPPSINCRLLPAPLLIISDTRSMKIGSTTSPRVTSTRFLFHERWNPFLWIFVFHVFFFSAR